MKNKWLVILLTALIFISIAILGVTSVYRIDKVTLNAYDVSGAAQAEEEVLQQKLSKLYVGENMFFADEKEAEKLLQEFPCLRLSAFKKSYPNRIIVEVTEEAEVYAVGGVDNNYYILSGDGTVLGVRNSYINRLDGAENVLLKGMQVSGHRGGALTGDKNYLTALSICRKTDELLNGIRRNVVGLEVLTQTPDGVALPDGVTIFCMTMREGVKIYIYNPSSNTEQKTQKAIEKYLSLNDGERLTGKITVSDNSEEIIVTYSTKE